MQTSGFLTVNNKHVCRFPYTLSLGLHLVSSVEVTRECVEGCYKQTVWDRDDVPLTWVVFDVKCEGTNTSNLEMHIANATDGSTIRMEAAEVRSKR